MKTKLTRQLSGASRAAVVAYSFNEWALLMRRELGCSILEVERVTGIPATTLSGIEKYGLTVSIENAERIANAFGWELSDVVSVIREARGPIGRYRTLGDRATAVRSAWDLAPAPVELAAAPTFT